MCVSAVHVDILCIRVWWMCEWVLGKFPYLRKFCLLYHLYMIVCVSCVCVHVCVCKGEGSGEWLHW